MPLFSQQRVINAVSVNDNPTKNITEGTVGGDIYAGFNTVDGNDFYGVFGSIDDDAWNGEIIVGAYYLDTLGDKFTLLFGGNVASNIFTSVTPQDGSTHLSNTTFTQGYNSGDNFTFWVWLESPPARWDASGASTLILT